MNSFGYESEYAMYQDAMQRRAGGQPRRFDEFYRCYPVTMLPGPDRPHLNHGGKVFLPASALDKLTKLHIAYPMLFELINGAADKTTHAGVLEFTAEEGKVYLPSWLMNTLLLSTGDLVQVKSTDLSPGSFIKLQAQSTDFLEITDPKAVLENAFRNFSCLTVNDIFSFEYNDTVYEVAVLEVKPDLASHAICTMETDLSVDFAAPVGYVEPSVASRKPSIASGTQGGKIHTQGTMAQRINYDSIAPSAGTVAAGHQAVASHFANEGYRLSSKKASKSSTGTSTPALATEAATIVRANGARNGPQPLRLAKGALFFGYDYKPPPKRDADGKVVVSEGAKKPTFSGMGQTLRGKMVEAKDEPAEEKKPAGKPEGDVSGHRLGKKQ